MNLSLCNTSTWSNYYTEHIIFIDIVKTVRHAQSNFVCSELNFSGSAELLLICIKWLHCTIFYSISMFVSHRPYFFEIKHSLRISTFITLIFCKHNENKTLKPWNILNMTLTHKKTRVCTRKTRGNWKDCVFELGLLQKLTQQLIIQVKENRSRSFYPIPVNTLSCRTECFYWCDLYHL